MVVIGEIEQIRAVFLKYTRKAYQRLPHIGEPQILDIGCGSGVPAIQLAKLSDGKITGIDIDQSCIDEFNKKIKQEGLTNRVKAINLSFSEMKFPDETFDIIWSEGVIGKLHFEDELKNWRRLLKQNGYLVIHYQISAVSESLSRIPSFGYVLVDTISLPSGAWWAEFYKPIEEKMCFLFQKYQSDPDASKLLKMLQHEIAMVKKSPDDFDTAFFIMKKV